MVKIDAKNQLGEDIDEELFADLYDSFENVFPHFPQDYEFQVVYEQCKLTTQSLAAGFSRFRLAAFLENCGQPFANIVSSVNSNYTILAASTANPSAGPAPLTVTFDARASLDPSDETIPTNNYYRYYRDVDNVDRTIGIGPVVNHTFEEAGNYIVHLTVRSSNKHTEGIFDGERSMSIDVSPKSAVLSVYANGQKLDTNEIVKIGVQEAQRGVVFDASSTIPIGGRRLEQHEFVVTSTDGFGYRKIGEGTPGVFTVALPDK